MKAKVLSLALALLLPSIGWAAPVDPSYWENQRDVIIDDGFVYGSNRLTGFYNGYVLMDYIGESGEVVIPDSVVLLSTSAFWERHHVKSITIPASVITIDGGAGGANSFQFCDNLEAFYVAEGNPTWSAEDGVLFNFNKALIVMYPPAKKAEEYVLPASVTSCSYVGSTWGFGSENPYLKRLTLPAGAACVPQTGFPNLESIEVDAHSEMFTSIDGVLYNKDVSELIFCPQGRTKALVIPKTVEKLDPFKLARCNRLTGVSVEAGGHFTVKDDILYTADEAQLLFCTRTKRGNVTGLPATLRSIYSRAFAYSTGITNVDLPSGVESIGDEAFLNCSGMRDLSLPAVKDVGKRAFSGCTNLQMINLPRATTVGQEAFSECTALMIAALPDVVTLGDSCFKACSALSDVMLATTCEFIGKSAFKDCVKLSGIVIPQGVSVIEEFTFRGCSSLTSIVLPLNLDSVKTGAFMHCALQRVRIPASVVSLQQQAFAYCNDLKEVVVEWGTPPEDVYRDAFLGITGKRSTLVVPIGAKKLYEDQMPWRNFNIIDEYTLPSFLPNGMLGSEDITVVSAPGADAVTIRLREGIALESVQVFDLSGKRVYCGTSAEIRKSEIGNNVKGYYILDIKTSHGNYQERVLL